MQSFKETKKKTEFQGKCPMFYNEEHTKLSADLNLHAFEKQNGSQRCNCGLNNTYKIASLPDFSKFPSS